VRLLGVDLGSKRIGIAVSDSMGVMASPLTVLERSGDRKQDHKAIARLATEEEAGAVIVGLPIDLKGEQAIAAQAVLAEVAEMATVVDVPIKTHDERMTTAVASRHIGTSKKAKARVDQVAAAIILQGWLDSQR
jgi:putative holliday junction resolvase